MPPNSSIAIIIIGGIALISGLLGGGVKVSQLELPHMSGWLRALSFLIGFTLIVLGVVLDPTVKNPMRYDTGTEPMPIATPTNFESQMPTLVSVSSPQPSSTVRVLPTETNVAASDPNSAHDSLLADNPFSDPNCDNRLEPIREPAKEGEQRVYVRCPIGQVQYSVQVDDILNAIVLNCPNETPQNLAFERNDQRSKDQILQTFDTKSFISRPGCTVSILITNGSGEMGYTVWQEVIGSLPDKNTIEQCLDNLTGNAGSIEAACSWWKATAWGGESKEYDPAGCYGIAWNVTNLDNTVVVFEKKVVLNLGLGGWAVQMCPRGDVSVSAEDVGRIQAAWNHLAYPGEWNVQVLE